MQEKPTDLELRTTQDHFGFGLPDPIEKDWYVVQAMRVLLTLDTAPFQLVFGGGTCLARAHRLVQRMSEDVDFKVVLQDGHPAPGSGNQLRRALGHLRGQVTAALQAAGFALAQVTAGNDNQYIAYQLGYEGAWGASLQLRPTLQVELHYSALRQPPVERAVGSLVAEAFGRPAEISETLCVSVSETAAEKLVALMRRTAMALAGIYRAADQTLVRHIYDLHMVRDRLDPGLVVAMAREIAQADAEEYRHQFPAYLADIAGESRKALTTWQHEPASPILYENFAALMVYGEVAPFELAIATVADLVEKAWP